MHDFDTDRSNNYTPQIASIPSSYITAITHNQDGEIFVGTKNGMAIYNIREELVSAHQKKDGNITVLSSNTIRALFVDIKNDL